MKILKHIVAVVLLVLYLYNLGGYLAVFSITQHMIRAATEDQIHSPDSGGKRIVLSFETQQLHRGYYPIQWKRTDEILYLGRLYDIVAVHESGDTTQFVCTNDRDEEKLYDNLSDHVGNQCNGTYGHPAGGTIENLLKDSLPTIIEIFSPPPSIQKYGRDVAKQYESVVLDIQAPPPRTPAVL